MNQLKPLQWYEIGGKKFYLKDDVDKEISRLDGLYQLLFGRYTRLSIRSAAMAALKIIEGE